MITDIHSHILPGIDDGVQTTDETQTVLRLVGQENIRYLAFTPHYYPSKRPLDQFLWAREHVLKKVKKLPEWNDFVFSLGAEVYFTETLFNYNNLESLCYTGTRLMLTELEYENSFTPSMERRLSRLIEDYGITPVLAHIDRYSFLIRDPALLCYLREKGCLFQMNLPSFLSRIRRYALIRICRMGIVDFLGEDIHTLPITGEKRKKLLQTVNQKDPNLIPHTNESAIRRIFSPQMVSSPGKDSDVSR